VTSRSAGVDQQSEDRARGLCAGACGSDLTERVDRASRLRRVTTSVSPSRPYATHARHCGAGVRRPRRCVSWHMVRHSRETCCSPSAARYLCGERSPTLPPWSAGCRASPLAEALCSASALSSPSRAQRSVSRTCMPLLFDQRHLSTRAETWGAAGVAWRREAMTRTRVVHDPRAYRRRCALIHLPIQPSVCYSGDTRRVVFQKWRSIAIDVTLGLR
jgi:hypothetical protein